MPKKSFLISIQEELKEGAFWTITSSELPGLFLGGQNIELLHQDLPAVIKQLFKLNYRMDVEVSILVVPECPPNNRKGRAFTAMPLAA